MIGSAAGAAAARASATTTCALALLAPLATAPAGGALWAQETAVPGVSLGLIYENTYVPPIAVKPFAVQTPGDEELAREIEMIVARDLDFSDRFLVRDSLPAAFAGEGVQYELWEQFKVDWLLSGSLADDPSGPGRVLTLEAHDVVYGSLQERGTFPIPEIGDVDFRMAVHAVSDAVVEWVTGEVGMAATSVVFAMRAFGEPRGKELYTVDSDGENLRRLTWDQSLVASPVWSPDGTRIAYSSWREGSARLYERDLETGRDRALVPDGAGQQLTPSYRPDGAEIAFSVIGAEPRGLYSYSVDRNCCLTHLGGGPYHDLSPGYSPDGSEIVFMSNRLGVATPQIYVGKPGEGTPELLSPYRYGEGGYFADPDWSPVSSRIAFAGGIAQRRTANRYQIFVADVQRGDNWLVQLTREGNNEDPSWAVDGRHIVFSGRRDYGSGLFVVDAQTGRLRVLVPNVEPADPDWSPPLAGAGAR